MRYAHIIRKLYAEPLLIEESAWRAFDHALRDVMQRGKITLPEVEDGRLQMGDGRARHPATLSPIFHLQSPARADIGDPEEVPALPRHCRIMDLAALDTAVIYVDGVIDKHVSMMDLMCYGGVDLDDVDAALDQVRKDDAIKNLLLVFNSPGGSVIGVPETAAKVAALSRIKNVKAFSDSICCSAGIYIASQASEFFVAPSTYSGSIGVISPPIIDISRALATQGITATTIKSGKFKDTGTPFRPITEEEIAMLQARCDKIYGMFTDAVRNGRGSVSDETMQGQTFFGDEAVEVGLADAVLPDLAAALAQF
jgi:signal peptide peptidase SppA